MLTWWIMATIKSITFAVPNEESVLKKKRVLSPAHQIKYNNSNNKKPEATKSNEKKRSKCPSNFPLSMDCAHVTSAATMTIKMNTIERRFSIVTKAFSISSYWMMSVRCDWLRLDHCVGFGLVLLPKVGTLFIEFFIWCFYIMKLIHSIVKILMNLSQTFRCTLELFFH